MNDTLAECQFSFPSACAGVVILLLPLLLCIQRLLLKVCVLKVSKVVQVNTGQRVTGGRGEFVG